MLRRMLLALGIVTLLCPVAAIAVDGVIEINQTSILAGGGFPYTVPAAGSYVLTSNLTPPPGAFAIVLGPGVANVEIDLNGFAILSPGGAGSVGIDSGGNPGLTVRRGVIQGFGGAAIVAASASKVIETKLTLNGAGVVGGVDCLIVMNNILSNTNPGGSGAGVEAQHCKIENNVIASNAGAGIAGAANVIVHNTIRNNLGGGILEAPPGAASTIQQNMINANTGFGISDGTAPVLPLPFPPPPPPAAPGRTNIIGNTISDTLAGPPGGRGINFSIPVLISDNTITNNTGSGIFCGHGCVVNGNSVDSNNTPPFAPGEGGVVVGDGSSVYGNSISWNPGFGLTLTPTVSYTSNAIVGNGPPNVVGGPTVTGPPPAAGNVCAAPPAAPVPCP